MFPQQQTRIQNSMATQPDRNLISMFLLGGAAVLFTLVLIAFSNFGANTQAIADPLAGRLNWVIFLHLCTIVPAIPLGFYVLWRKKGDRLHKLLGRTWAVLMLTAAISALWIGDPNRGILGTHFSPIHIFSIVTIVSIPWSVYDIRRGNVEGHYKGMQGVFIGLIIAGLFAFLPGRILGILLFG